MTSPTRKLFSFNQHQIAAMCHAKRVTEFLAAQGAAAMSEDAAYAMKSRD